MVEHQKKHEHDCSQEHCEKPEHDSHGVDCEWRCSCQWCYHLEIETNVDHGEEPEVVEHQKKHEHDCCQEHREKPEHERHGVDCEW